MKNIKKLVFVALTLATFSSFAQESPKNAVKVNLLSAIGNTAALEYERAITNKFSLNATVALMPKGNLPFKSSFSEITDGSSIIDETKLGATSFALEGRFYLSKKNVLNGFYLGPFVKYSKYNVDTRVEFDVPAGEDPFLPVSGNLNAFSGGVSLGIQFKLAKQVSLDWRIIGLSYGSTSGKLSGDRLLNEDEQDEIRSQVDDLADNLPIFKLTNEVSGSGLKSTFSGPWAGVRTGLSIGYKF